MFVVSSADGHRAFSIVTEVEVVDQRIHDGLLSFLQLPFHAIMHGLIDATELGERRGWKEFNDADGKFIGGVGVEGNRHGYLSMMDNRISIFSKK